MDMTNKKNKRIRLDWEFDHALSVEEYKELLDAASQEEYEIRSATTIEYYEITKVHSLIMNSRWTDGYTKFEVCVHMIVDLGELVGRYED